MLRYGRAPLLIHHVLDAFAAKYITCSCFRVDGICTEMYSYKRCQKRPLFGREQTLSVFGLCIMRITFYCLFLFLLNCIFLYKVR